MRLFPKALFIIVFLSSLFTRSWAEGIPCPRLMDWLSTNYIQGPIPGTAPIDSLFVVPENNFLKSFIPLSQKSPVPVVVPSKLVKHWIYDHYTDYRRIDIYPEIVEADEQFNFTSLWARDYLPTLVRNSLGELEFVQFTYFQTDNSRALKLYNKYAQGLARLSEVPLKKSSLIFQGGNLIVDEEGTLFLSRKVEFENPQWPKKTIEAELKKKLYVKSIVWLPALPAPLDQTGHLDIYMKYVGKRHFVVADSSHPVFARLMDQATRRLVGLGYSVSRLSNAHNGYRAGENPSISTYTNSVIVNGTLLMPIYDDPGANQMARQVYESLGFKVEGIDATDAIKCGGSIHCLTREIFIPLPTVPHSKEF